MQQPIFCSHCAAAISAAVPELTGDVWHMNCPACGAFTQLTATLGKPEELPSFSAVDASFARSMLSELKA
jgi:hypothetical protein